MTDTISPTLKAKTLLWIAVRDVVLIKSMREDEASDFIMYNKSARALLDYIAELEQKAAALEKYQRLERDGNVLLPMPNPWGKEDEIYDQDGEK